MASPSEEKPALISRRQALRSAGKALAGAVGLAAIPSLPTDAQSAAQQIEALPKQPGELPQREIPSAGEKLRIASCQFPVSADVAANAKYIQGFMHDAASEGAHLLHTSEACLTGYGGQDLPNFDKFDWVGLRKETSNLRSLAQELKIYLVLGSAHFLDEKTRPTNCVYLIAPDGTIADRYDKSFLTKHDQLAYTAGNRRVTCEIRGVKLGLAICYDICWPQLYIAYRELGVMVMLHSMYNAHDKGPTRLDTLNTYEVPTRCTDNRVWAVCNNSSRPYSHWGSFVARPDATIPKQLPINEPGMLTYDFPDTQPQGEYYFNLRPMGLRDDEIMSWGMVSQHPRRLDGRSEP